MAGGSIKMVIFESGLDFVALLVLVGLISFASIIAGYALARYLG